MNVGFSPAGFGGPQGVMSTQDFKAELKNQTNEDLIKALGDNKLSPAAKELIGKELEERMNAKGAEGAGGAGESEGDGDDLKKLLKKLQDGTISPEEMKKLIGKELEERMNAKGAEGAGGAGESEGDGDDLKKLLKKLQDGTISPEEMKKLSSMLGVDVATLEKAKGKEAGGGDTGGEIQGG